jgi:diaminopropionate ammonia-lyase
VDFKTVDYYFLKSKEVLEKTGVLTFTTASDGNHGRGVAWTAAQLGHKAIVFLPEGTVESRIDVIRKTGAEVVVTKFDYDRTVELAKEMAQENGWELVQDTAFENYREIPEWIMQGYTTMVYEVIERMIQMGVEKPSHIFLQAGVGSMAASVLGCFVNEFGISYPLTAIIEPHQAACFYDSVVIGDGRAHPAKGNLKTMMAGLSCGVPSIIAWDILKNFSDMMISCPDYLAAEGIKIFARPLGSDKKIVSGESGAVGIGLLSAIMKDERNAKIRKQLRLNKDSIILLFNTEGDTDPENYRKIVGQ